MKKFRIVKVASNLYNLCVLNNYGQNAKEISREFENEIVSSNIREVIMMSSVNCVGKNTCFNILIFHFPILFKTFSNIFPVTLH